MASKGGTMMHPMVVACRPCEQVSHLRDNIMQRPPNYHPIHHRFTDRSPKQVTPPPSPSCGDMSREQLDVHTPRKNDSLKSRRPPRQASHRPSHAARLLFDHAALQSTHRHPTQGRADKIETSAILLRLPLLPAGPHLPLDLPDRQQQRVMCDERQGDERYLQEQVGGEAKLSQGCQYGNQDMRKCVQVEDFEGWRAQSLFCVQTQ
ncbi:hypothetical protein KC334_g64 [Hortaea werneckii]|nr:hypothetical protein KC334_g64 [Hortaea werneckii]KAI7028407.1 hypothetical protein KC355_g65 [Hortaea werneckii]